MIKFSVLFTVIILMASNVQAGTCQAQASAAALVVEQISARRTGCESGCNDSVKLISVKSISETTGRDSDDILGSFEVVVGNNKDVVRGRYQVDIRSFDIGICSILKVELTGRK